MSKVDLSRVAELVMLAGIVPDVVLLEDVASTQDSAHGLVKVGAPAFTIVLSKSQNSGRGRLGRSWHSPAGGLYCTVILRPSAPVERWPSLSILVGVALVETLARHGVVSARLKWPNDCLVGGRKVAGILAEAEPSSGVVLVGIGLNVDLRPGDIPSEISQTAGDLASNLPQSADLDLVCADGLSSVCKAVRSAEPLFEVEPDRVWPLLWSHGVTQVGNVTGRVIGLGRRGDLLLATTNGTVSITVGEVRDAGGD